MEFSVSPESRHAVNAFHVSFYTFRLETRRDAATGHRCDFSASAIYGSMSRLGSVSISSCSGIVRSVIGTSPPAPPTPGVAPFPSALQWIPNRLAPPSRGFPRPPVRSSARSLEAPSTARTFLARSSRDQTLWRVNSAPRSRTPWRSMMLSVYPDMNSTLMPGWSSPACRPVPRPLAFGIATSVRIRSIRLESPLADQRRFGAFRLDHVVSVFVQHGDGVLADFRRLVLHHQRSPSPAAATGAGLSSSAAALGQRGRVNPECQPPAGSL